MRFDGILVHYAELATKGRNRSVFVQSLARNLRRALHGPSLGGIKRLAGRLFVYPRDGESFDEAALARVAEVPGVANYAPALKVPVELAAIKEAALALVRERTYESFRVRAQRAFKQLPLRSQEVACEVGAFLLTHKPAKVRMKGADLELVVEMLPEGAFIYADRRQGLGGLPVGTGGNLVCLLSGGIDSPVAAHRMQRRGATLVFVHFHSRPFLDGSSIEKAKELASLLARAQGGGQLYLVPIGELQREVVLHAPPSLRVILYRRFMVRIAAMIAARTRALALVTGEALGQVASQTLSNLAVIDEASPLMILRPLISFDKQEIIDEARRLGTYEISIMTDQDCCQLFVPRSPETHARLEDVLSAERDLEVSALCAKAMEAAQISKLDAAIEEPPR